MRLYFSPTSPYVRKVLVTAIETGLDDRIDKVARPEGPSEDALARANPLAKVPALILDDGEVLYDSPVICEYLDSQHGGTPVFPAKGPERWASLRRQALADGILDAAILRRMEEMRPADKRLDEAAAKQWLKVTRAIDALESEATAGRLTNPGGKPTIGDIAAGCALGYLDLRFAVEDWRHGRAALTAWYEAMAQRRSFRETVPPA